MALWETISNRVDIFRSKSLGIADVARWAGRKWPDRELIHLDKPSEFDTLHRGPITGKMLASFVEDVASLLRKVGVERYDRVAIFKQNAADIVLLTLAVVRAGAVAVPINVGMKLDDLRDYTEYTGATTIITDLETFDTVIQVGTNLPLVQRWLVPTLRGQKRPQMIDMNRELAAGLPRAPAHLTPGDLGVIIAHTSGTTGMPKGVLGNDRSIMANARLMSLVSPMTCRTRSATAFPFNHRIAIDSILATLISGFPLWAVADRRPEAILSMLQDNEIRVFSAFPDVFLNIYYRGFDDYDLKKMRCWLSGGDASHEAHMQAFVRAGGGRRGSVFVETFGTSEVGSAALVRLFTRRSKATGTRFVGRPLLGGPKVKIATEDGQPLPANTIGRVMVKGDMLFAGYWNAHDRLYGVKQDGWWWTGDVGLRDKSGRFYHFDREGDVLRTSAGVAYSLLVEEVLLTHPDIAEAIVVAIGEGDSAFIAAQVCARQHCQVDVEALRVWANEQLAVEQQIAEIVQVPLNAVTRGLTGKVLKRRIRESWPTA